jgi:type 2 lantibiotic biosynthesis protein LanM
VAILTFEGGLKLVYKPRSVSLDAAFHDFLAWTADRGLGPAQRRMRTLDRGEYGWVEFVEQEAFATAGEVRDYFHRAGALLCLAYVLRARDLHMENLIATRGGPVLVDLELTLQPVPRSVTALPSPSRSDHADGDSRDQDHALSSGLLTLVEASGADVFDIGGLRGTGGGTSAIGGRRWHALETDEIHFTEEKTFQSRVRNAVVLDGAVQAPDAWSAAIEQGFTEAYRFLLAHRDAVLAPGGPLARLAGCPTRVLPRPTTQYAALSYLLARPQYQKDGCRWSSALDALNRTVSQSHDRPEVWPVLVAERRALELLDVPHFTVKTDETAVYAGSRLLLDGYYAQSGLDAVTERLQRLSEEHFAAELDRVRDALAVSIHSRYATEPVHDEGSELDVTSGEFLVAHALWIAHELVAQSQVTARGREWVRDRRGAPAAAAPAFRRHHLYDGSTGPALFFAAVAAETGDAQWAGVAREALGPLRADLAVADPEADDLGVGSGLGSIAYGLAMMSSLLEDAELAQLGGAVAAHITPERIARDTALDLVAGSAGAALGLLALHRLTRDPITLDRAIRCGERLLETAMTFDGGSGWRTADGRVYTGLAHGVAGIAYALSRLHDVTADRRFGRAAAGGYKYVASRFLEGAGNWPILGEPAEGLPAQGATMTAWCHGAPGIALATAAGTADTVDPRLLEELEAALKTAAAASPHKADHLCCGNIGRCEALFTSGRRLMRRDAYEGARRLARVVIARARHNGHFRLTASGFDYRIFDPGFFRGLSGIGYSLLHLASPAHLPSVAAFEAPPSAPRPRMAIPPRPAARS